MNVFETFPECSPPSIVSKKKNACTRANHAHYSSVHVNIFSSLKHTLLKQHLGKNLTGRKCGAYRTISYSFCKICRALCIAIEKKKDITLVLRTLSAISVFPSDKFFTFFLNSGG